MSIIILWEQPYRSWWDLVHLNQKHITISINNMSKPSLSSNVIYDYNITSNQVNITLVFQVLVKHHFFCDYYCTVCFEDDNTIHHSWFSWVQLGWATLICQIIHFYECACFTTTAWIQTSKGQVQTHTHTASPFLPLAYINVFINTTLFNHLKTFNSCFILIIDDK